MGIEKTFGGNRLGSGKKMQTELHNYERSTHNLDRIWRSSMAPGVLTPCFVEVGLPGDTFDIDIKSIVKTLPTTAPLYGSFKMQVDMFTCPVRLYNGILHNNPLNIGMKADQVKLPTIQIDKLMNEEIAQDTYATRGNSSSSLLTYLGIRGIGNIYSRELSTGATAARTFKNAVPILAYYDIFKNYYANKQEKNAYVIGAKGQQITATSQIETVDFNGEIKNTKVNKVPVEYVTFKVLANTPYKVTIFGENLNTNITTGWDTVSDPTAPKQKFDNTYISYITDYKVSDDRTSATFTWTSPQTSYCYIFRNGISNTFVNAEKVNLQAFPLDNIDGMRESILNNTHLGVAFNINERFNKLPYSVNYNLVEGVSSYTTGAYQNEFTMAGLCVKTYQNDIFNNWLNSEFVDGGSGLKGITEASKIDTKNGLTMDALNLAKKVYDFLNRVAVSGGTYQDWGEAAWGEKMARMCESPIYEGGYSTEIYFDEVVSNNAGTDSAPLGTLGGRGVTSRDLEKGGHLTIKVDEPSILMGIVSITPRIDYTQGNEWYMTELESIDDFHKPAFDGIGFQNLMAEQVAWEAATMEYEDQGDPDGEMMNKALAKLPAWMNYMTSYNRDYGTFAEPNNTGYMVLTRQYEIEEGEIKDFTSYIDPKKFNYAFADASLEAQNFWIQLGLDCKARRKMSGKLIPNV